MTDQQLQQRVVGWLAPVVVVIFVVIRVFQWITGTLDDSSVNDRSWLS